MSLGYGDNTDVQSRIKVVVHTMLVKQNKQTQRQMSKSRKLLHVTFMHEFLMFSTYTVCEHLLCT